MPTLRPDVRRPAEVPPDATMPAADRPGGPATPQSAHNVVPSALRAACGRGVLLFVGRSAAPTQQRAGRNAHDLVVQNAEALGVPTSCVQVLGVAEPPGDDASRRRPNAPDLRAAIRAASVDVVVPALGRLSRTTDGLASLLDDAARHDIWLCVAGRAFRPADPPDRLLLRMLALPA